MTASRGVREFQKIDPHLRGHRYFRRFVRLTGFGANLAHGILAGLWAFAYDQAQDGDLSKFDLDDIADVLEWGDDAENIWSALTDAGFVVNGIIHDWADWGGARYSERAYEAWKKANQREKKRQQMQEEMSRGQEGTSEMSRGQTGTSRGQKGTVPLEEIREEESNPPIVPPSENGLFDSAFWPRWPKRHGSKKLTHDRFYRLSKADQTRALTALDHLIAAIDDGRYGVEFLMRAENFVGGQKRYFEEWADGPPEKYAPLTPAVTPGFKRVGTPSYDEHGNETIEWREVPV